MLVHEDDLRRVDAAQVGAGGRDDGVEAPLGRRGDVVAPLPRARIVVDDDHVPPCELERARVDPREAELQHTSRRLAEQLEDARGRRGGEGRRQTHGYSLDMSEKGTGKFLGVPYDWRRPTVARFKSRWWNADDRRIFTPKTYGAGWDINLREVARRLGLKD